TITSIQVAAAKESTVRELYDTFAAEFTREADRTRARFEQARGDTSGVENATLDWWDARQKLEDQFEDDAKNALVDENEVNTWWRAMAAVRRRYVLKEIHDVQRVRNACDLLLLLEPIALTAEEHARVDEILANFEHDMDERLHAFQIE